MFHDQWLSNFLQKDAFHIKNPEELKKSDLKIKNAFLDSRVNSNDIKSIIKLQEYGFKCFDISVELIKKGNEKLEKNKLLNWDIRFANNQDEFAVRKLASDSFIKSRFYKDPNIPNAIASRVKEEWVGNFFKGERGDFMIIAEKNELLLGFMLLIKDKNNKLIIDLIAVNNKQRNSGIAKSMISSLPHRLEIKNYTTKVGTQIDNINAINLYLSMGFKIVSSNFIFHLHL